MKRIGILAGTFDPVHLGHIDFIERIISEKLLDKVYLLVEKKPKHKPVFVDFKDRIKMLSLAINHNSKIKIHNCQVENYPISHCLPKIKNANRTAQFYLLLGRDVAEHIPLWENSDNLLNGVELLIAHRDDGITSGKIRNALSLGQDPNGLDPKVLEYINSNNLYGSETISGA